MPRSVKCSTARLQVRIVLALAAIALAAAPGRATVVGRASGSGGCGVTAYATQYVPLQVPVQTTTTPLPGGGISFESECGASDGFNFGIGLLQNFIATAGVFGFGEARPGVLRAYLGVGCLVSPTRYEYGVYGASPYGASAGGAVNVGVTDTFVVPATNAAPNLGDATTITLEVGLSCVETANYTVEWDYQTSIGASISTADDVTIDYISLQTVIQSGYPGLHAPCPISNHDFPKIVNVHVGDSLKVTQGIGISISMIYDCNSGHARSEGYTDALHTGRVMLFSADGTPLTGESGWTYDVESKVPTLPTLTATSSTSTTLPVVTTTTLPGCGETCGDGQVQAACGETCECPTTADPIKAAYGCAGAAIVPAQDDCTICRGCTLDLHICAAAAGATTTTTLIGGSTTSTTMPSSASCAALSGAPLGRCLLDTALAAPLCGVETLPTALDRSLRAQLRGASTRLGQLPDAASRKRTKLLKKVQHLMDAARRSSASAAKRKKKPISSACATTVGDLTTQVSAAIAP